MIKAILFDIGGVVVKDPMDGIYRAVGKKFGVDWKKVKKSFHKLDPLITTDRISPKVFWSKMTKYLHIENVSELEKEWLKSFEKVCVIHKNVRKIVKNLKGKGYKIAVISDTIKPHKKLHRKLGHYKYFHKVFLSCDVKIEKPDVRIYQYATKKLGVKPSDCVFIDDKHKNIVGARKAGMKAILLSDATQLENKLKKYL